MTIGNCLEGAMYSVKKLHYEPITMNSQVNKEKGNICFIFMVLKFYEFIKTFYRHAYVQQLNAYVSAGKQIIWMDETNFNLFIRRKTGRSRVGTLAVVMLPAARGPNVHLIGAMKLLMNGFWKYSISG